MTEPVLTPEEDGTLRRLTFFETSGLALAPALRLLRAELRARDRRTDVREPQSTVVRLPHYA